MNVVELNRFPLNWCRFSVRSTDNLGSTDDWHSRTLQAMSQHSLSAFPCWKRSGNLIPTSSTVKPAISIPSQHRINLFDYTRTVVFSTRVGKAINVRGFGTFLLFELKRKFNRFLLRSWCFRLTIKAACPMNLENFPMDVQRCPLKLGSCEWHLRNLVKMRRDKFFVSCFKQNFSTFFWPRR